MYFLEMYDGLSKTVAFDQNCGILQIKMDQSGEHTKMNFDFFSNTNMNVTNS